MERNALVDLPIVRVVSPPAHLLIEPRLLLPTQGDLDGDGNGDSCDPDIDGDTVINSQDNCPHIYNPTQHDSDRDLIGDTCDNCKRTRNPNQVS